MKKSTIITLWVAISLMFFGGILAVSTYAISGGNIGIYYGNNSYRAIKGANSYTVKDRAEFSDISSLDIDSDVGEIKIALGDTGGKFIVEYSYPSNEPAPSCKAEDGIFKFASLYNAANGINFELFDFGPINNEVDYSITITYPQDTAFNKVNILANVGSVNLKNISADKIEIESNLGEVHCEDVTSSSFSSSSDAGSTYIKNSRLGMAEISSNLGEIVANNISTSSLDISSDAGSVTVNGELSGKTEIENGLGSISAKTSLPRTAYNLDLEISFGNINLDGKSMGTTLEESNNAANTMQIQSDSGSIELDFSAA